MKMHFPSLATQVRFLLRKSHVPAVEVRSSSIVVVNNNTNNNKHDNDNDDGASTAKQKGAGRGVFTTRHVDNAGEVLCLYPGVYTAGLPLLYATSTTVVDGTDVFYLAKDIVSPSGLALDDNAYILNLGTNLQYPPESTLPSPANSMRRWGRCTGGYIDGLALDSSTVVSSSFSSKSIQHAAASATTTTCHPRDRPCFRLDENPSACAHFINHSVIKANVQVVAFEWRDIFDFDYQQQQQEDKDDDCYFPLPNVVRQDGAPWYALFGGAAAATDGEDTIVSFSKHDDKKGMLESNHHGVAVQPPNCGAAMVSTRSIEANQELLLNYGLRPPYPPWAQGWYSEQI